MSDTEEDYMSEAFLEQTKSVRPGLVPGNKARQFKQDTKHKKCNKQNALKPLKVREHEEREKGMSAAIPTNNIGFAMLQKMGYKQGMGLGKEESGRAEPVPIEVKADRGGLGRAAHLKRRQEIRERLEVEAMRKRKRMMGSLKGDYQKRKRMEFTDKKVEQDLYTSQKACEHLDKQQEHDLPVLSWYWPPRKEEPKIKQDGEEEEEDEEEEEEEEPGSELTPQEKLKEITDYLRSTYLYCTWCGTSYNDEDDLKENCPGNTADAHD